MSEGHLSQAVNVDDATKPIPTSLTTTIHVPPVNTSEDSNRSVPTSPTDLPTVVATKPSVVLGGPLARENGETSEALPSIPESPGAEEAVATTEGTRLVNGAEPSDEHVVDSDNEDSFGTPEAKVQSLPSPESTTIPLSPADVSATAVVESAEVAASIPLPSTPADATTVAAPPATGAPTSPKSSAHAKTPVLASLMSQPSGITSPTDPLSASSSSEVISPAPLDALLSPTETEGKFSPRDSVAASEATEDEARFSTVLLSARQSLAPTAKITVTTNDLHTVDEGTGSDENTLVDDWRQHKKSASNSTILSANNVPYLLSKLSEAEELEAETPSRVRPVSLQGTQAIKEEFYQRAEEEEARGQAEVDWGASCRYLCCRCACNLVAFVHRFLGSSHQWYTLSSHICASFAESLQLCAHLRLSGIRRGQP